MTRNDSHTSHSLHRKNKFWSEISKWTHIFDRNKILTTTIPGCEEFLPQCIKNIIALFWPTSRDWRNSWRNKASCFYWKVKLVKVKLTTTHVDRYCSNKQINNFLTNDFTKHRYQFFISEGSLEIKHILTLQKVRFSHRSISQLRGREK